MDILIILALLIIVLVYTLYRLWPNEIAESIKGIVFEDVREDVLMNFLEASRIKKLKIERIDLRWGGWQHSVLEDVMNILSGYGDAFRYALAMRKFYFRELLMKIGSVKVVRAWLYNAIRFGLIDITYDSHGILCYKVSREGLEQIRDYILSAMEDLL